MKYYEDYLKLVNDAYANIPAWRYGQTLFNILYDVDQELAEEIRSTELDPFFTIDQDKINNFLTFVKNRWESNG
jgi:hypothetical protein